MPAEVRDAMIVAGGRGTRLQPLTYTCPKPLLPFCGAPLLAGLVRRLAADGIERVFLVVGSDTQPFEVLRPQAQARGVELRIVPEREPLDTAGGVRRAVDEVDRPVLVVNGDVLTDLDYRRAIDRHLGEGADATLVLTRVEDTSAYGVCVREGTRIVGFVEKPDPGELPGQDAINAGTYVLDPAVLRQFPVGPLSFEQDVFPGVIADGGHVEGLVWEGVWQDLGTPRRWRAGHRLALDGALDWPSLRGVPSRPGQPGVRVAQDADLHEQADLRGPVLVLEGARLGAGADVGPHVVVGRGCRIGARAALRDSVLFDGVDVGAGVQVSGLVAGRGAAVEAGARLGRGVVLGDDQRIEADRVLGDGQRVPPARG